MEEEDAHPTLMFTTWSDHVFPRTIIPVILLQISWCGVRQLDKPRLYRLWYCWLMSEIAPAVSQAIPRQPARAEHHVHPLYTSSVLLTRLALFLRISVSREPCGN